MIPDTSTIGKMSKKEHAKIADHALNNDISIIFTYGPESVHLKSKKLSIYHFEDKNLNLLKKIKKINKLISEHEERIANPLLDYLSKRNNFKLIGKNQIKNKDRSPTISFTVKNKSSKKVSEILVKNNIATRNDNFYAWRCLEALGIDTNDGVVRISMTHYNNKKDVDNLINALELV